MAYSIEYSPTAAEQLLALPRVVADAVADTLAALSLDPFNHGRAPDEPLDESKRHRRVPFDGGFVWCLVLEQFALVLVTEVWAIG